ncbi:hypothetical protein [Oceanobacillus senegalensis]|nr:hypothetical protein [Oceanobacillus senegalensis]
MAQSRTNSLTMNSTTLTNLLSVIILILTVYHHFTVQEEIANLKRK